MDCKLKGCFHRIYLVWSISFYYDLWFLSFFIKYKNLERGILKNPFTETPAWKPVVPSKPKISNLPRYSMNWFHSERDPFHAIVEGDIHLWFHFHKYINSSKNEKKLISLHLRFLTRIWMWNFIHTNWLCNAND